MAITEETAMAFIVEGIIMIVAGYLVVMLVLKAIEYLNQGD
jgi:hypothetical protein